MHINALFPLPLLLSLLAFVSYASAQIAAGGGAQGTTVATQMATTTWAGSLYTSGGTTSATWILYTQTFASTALGSWAFETTSSGTIGLGTLEGTAGATKTKRAIYARETPPPM